ncbi:MAG TPA: cupin domain-containing protein [Gaiellaceae bacterium]|nr:cupin domain-containing protein [Gaiellaceae bacterium]
MDARERYDDVADFLAFRHDFVELSQMMGMPCVKARGKMVLGFPAGYGAMVFKLTDPAVHAEALGLEGSVLFDPGRNGRPFKQWVVVPPAHAGRFLEGELTVSIGPEGTVVVPAGTLVYVPPMVAHGFRNGADVDMRYLNFHAPGKGFADYLRAGRDGVEGSFDQADPPADGGRPPEEARIGESEVVQDEIEIHELRLEPDAPQAPVAHRRLRCLYVLEGSPALADDVLAETGTWVRLSEPRQTLTCAGSEPVRFLDIHV